MADDSVDPRSVFPDSSQFGADFASGDADDAPPPPAVVGVKPQPVKWGLKTESELYIEKLGTPQGSR